ncbi:thiaminase II [Paenibacillus radicis (ex Gao et al. 2016)]|uniref:Aminopyrimidine aminohydrolase n=1 Tax=Paenibacillus radicis (ex Gao et al. 2016) TaxID=1737354 RepID=A0A917HGW4_9BACL|nr:thiaminase II [Paenibacillus radicis (ex Gao et al. 2016)]GGG79280.1 aminopyrimidine aminohydrolase [Paenibacillus radicis (ex Gao et al. 2016)]
MVNMHVKERFSDRLYEGSKDIWEQSHRHPFLAELKAGTLDPERFKYYLMQDYVYLIDYAKMFAFGSIKAGDLEMMGKFSALCDSTLNVEMGLHRQYAEKFGVTREQLESTEPSPTTVAYTKYLLDVAAQGTLAEVTAAVLPCMWSYREIGVLFTQDSAAMEHPLYGEWIRMYGSPEFSELTDWCIGVMDRLAEGLAEPELAKLERHFLIASKLEYMFWDMAYRQEEWPV